MLPKEVQMQESEVIALIAKRAKEEGSANALARLWGVTPSYLCDLLKGKRKPGPKILGPLGLRRVVIETYQKAAKP
jgi:hypothetical protein